MASDARFAEVQSSGTRFQNLQQNFSSFSLDPEKQVVLVRFCGKITAEEIANYSKNLLACRDFNPAFSEIADLTEVTEFALQPDDFLNLADKIDPFRPEAKRAFVVSASMHNYAARIHKVLRNGGNIKIFRSLEEALKWIGE